MGYHTFYPPFGSTAFRLDHRICRVKAFTLIELLTVIAIIGILAAILIPVASSARQAAQQSKNISTIRNLSMASFVFADDNDGKMPLSTYADGSPFHTTGPWLYANSGPRRLLSENWGGTGRTDYLPGPDSFYGPFTPKLEDERHDDGWARHSGNVFIMSYVFFSLPENDGGDPPRNAAGPGLWNDRVDNARAHHRTVIFSDMGLTHQLNDLSGFNGRSITAAHLDGSVSTFSFAETNRAASWFDRIRILSGMASHYRHLQ